MINRIKTDREIVHEAAINLAAAAHISEDDKYKQACDDMIEALRLTGRLEWDWGSQYVD
jgi:hypothetical protein